jgi:hypothetical protein
LTRERSKETIGERGLLYDRATDYRRAVDEAVRDEVLEDVLRRQGWEASGEHLARKQHDRAMMAPSQPAITTNPIRNPCPVSRIRPRNVSSTAVNDHGRGA